MSCGVGCRRGSDPALLWLWRRPVATAPFQPLAWEPPYAAGAAQEIATTTTTAKDKKRQKDKKKKGHNELLCRTDTDSQTLKNVWFPMETGWEVGGWAGVLEWKCYI